MSADDAETAHIALLTGGRGRVGASGIGDGRGLFVTSPVSAGETVFVEQPLVCAPAEFGMWECVCHACLQRESDAAQLMACKCRWAHFCSAACAAAGAAAHTDAECAAMVQLRYRREDYPGTVLLAARLLRTLHGADLDPARAAQAALTQTLVGTSPMIPPLTLQRFEGWAPTVLALAGCPASTADAVDALCRLLRNEFKVQDERDVAAGAALYPAIARANHACEPNVRARAEAWALRLEALVPLQAGDELRLSYVDCDEGQPAAQRAAHLRARFLFHCGCGARSCASRPGVE